MHLSLLQFIIIVASVIFFLFWVDLFKRKKANILHLIVFIWGSFLLILFSLNASALDKFWSFFWIARWADLLVYCAIILLWYFYISLLNTVNRQELKETQIIREVSIRDAQWDLWKADTVFIIPAYGEKDYPFNIVVKLWLEVLH